MATAETNKRGLPLKQPRVGLKVPAASPTTSPKRPPARKASPQSSLKTKPRAKSPNFSPPYTLHRGNEALDDFVRGLVHATPVKRMEAERAGVGGALVKALATSLGIPHVRMFEVIGIPKATAEKKAATNAPIVGAAGQSALGMVRLLGIAKDIVANSDAAEAKGFDTAKWLGRWIERPQPALGGRKPADVLDTPTGVETVVKLLGALESNVYL